MKAERRRPGGMRGGDRRNVIALAVGRKGSGKSTLLHRLFVQRTPRIISIDPNDEARDFNPDAIRTYGLAELRDALGVCVRHGNRWHISAALEEAELPAFFRWIAPPLTSRDVVSFSRQVGGVALECGEAYMIAPVTGAHPDVIGAWARGRHHLLSLYMATQRPAQCNRMLSGMADFIAVGQTFEPNDARWVERALGRSAAEAAALLPDFHFVYAATGEGRVWVIDGAGGVVRELTPRRERREGGTPRGVPARRT